MRGGSLILAEILRAPHRAGAASMPPEVALAFWEALCLVHQNRIDEAIERVAKYC